MLKPAFSPFHQMAWVTNDLERSLEMFRGVYGVPSFFIMEQSFDAVVGGEKGRMNLRIALANLDDVQLELIEPQGDGISRIYSDVLPRDGSYANVFHHVCVKVNGTLADWEAHLAGLHPDRPVHYVGDVGPDARFVYTDERTFLGHYVEHFWCGPETEAYLRQAIPHHHSA